MFVPLLVVPLAVQLIAAVDGVPKLDVTPSCHGAARAATQERLQGCIASENRTRDQLAKDWSSFSIGARAFCLASIRDFEPTYTELATCLEMRRDLANRRLEDAAPAAPIRVPEASTTGTGSPGMSR